MYHELWFDSATTESSSTKFSALNTPVFYFNKAIQGLKSAKVLEIIVPQSFYNFVDYPKAFSGGNPVDTVVNGVKYFAPQGHQAWRLEVYNPQTNASFDMKLPAGSGSAIEFTTYTNETTFGTDFATFQTAFTTLTGLVCTSAAVVYNPGPETIKWYINVSADVGLDTPPVFGIRFSEQLTKAGRTFAAYSLGFPLALNPFRNENFSLTFTSSFCNANPFNYICLQSKTLGPFFAVNPNSGVVENVYKYNIQNTSNTLAMMPLTSNYTSVNVWTDPNPGYRFTEMIKSVDRLDFYLTLGPYHEAPIDLNKQSFQVKIAIETEESVDMNKRQRFF